MNIARKVDQFHKQLQALPGEQAGRFGAGRRRRRKGILPAEYITTGQAGALSTTGSQTRGTFNHLVVGSSQGSGSCYF